MKILPFIISFVAALIFFVTSKNQTQSHTHITIPQQAPIVPEINQPEKPNITVEVPPYLSYSQIVAQFRKWKQEAKDYVEVGNYGKPLGTNIYYAKLTNKLSNSNKKKILLTGAIHGNEQWSTAIVMGCMGTILSKHTKVLDDHEIYIVPSVCPMTYSIQREINRLDPNRNFQSEQSLPAIQAIKSFFSQHQFDMVISGHTCGRVFLYPPGNTYGQANPEIASLSQKLAQLSGGYQSKQLCYAYPHIIRGTETDWYASQGAIALVCEIGTQMNAPTEQEIHTEFNRLFPAYLYFINYNSSFQK